MHLHPYQQKAVEDLRFSLAQGHKRVLLQAPTGSGKTVIASQIIQKALSKNKKVWVIAHRRELLFQAAEKLNSEVEYGFILGKTKSQQAQVQLASIQSLHRRKVQEQPDLIIIDEAHRSMAKSYYSLKERYPSATMIGLSATPIRSDGRGLGDFYDDLVHTPNIVELTELGYLVPIRYFAPEIPNLKGVRVRAGDYREEDLERVMNTPQLVGNITTWWQKITPNLPTIVFATSVAHSKELQRAFANLGVKSAHLDGNTPLEERKRVLEQQKNGEITVLCNCNLATEGVDLPNVQVVVIARPTQSAGLYIQMAGRALRPYPGKSHCYLIDHAGCFHQHGPVEDFKVFSLDTQKGQGLIKNPGKHRKKRVCPICKEVVEQTCPKCPAVLPRVVEGDLVEVNSADHQRKRQHFYNLLEVAKHNGYKPGWAAYRFKDIYGHFPSYRKRTGGRQ